MSIQQNPIMILDFGSQYTQLIARRIREFHVYSIIVPYHISVEEIKKKSPKGIILSGSPSSTYKKESPRCHQDIFALDIPILGICYGMQLMVTMLGGVVSGSNNREYGGAPLDCQTESPLFHQLPDSFEVWMSHGDSVLTLPNGFSPIGKTADTFCAAIAHPKKMFYGLQFHPEVEHTLNGRSILKNFCLHVCSSDQQWTVSSWICMRIKSLQEKIGSEKVILGLSGGVDSSVAAALLQRAIGKQLYCIFVDNGLLRSGERETIEGIFSGFSMNFSTIDASCQFLKALQGITDPEEKRKIIGHEFIRVFEAAATKIKNVRFLGQGTTYPDVIESISIEGNPSALIKSHHNVGGLPEKMKLELVEPIRDVFKDEVRRIGMELGLPKRLVMRQPFPGPGLGIRILGEITPSRLTILRKADGIVIEEIKKEELYYKIWQSFAVLLPIKSVGVMGDERTYEYTIVVRAVESIDGMTADWVRIPYQILSTISNRIINEVQGVNRVCYDVSSKPPATIEWE